MSSVVGVGNCGNARNDNNSGGGQLFLVRSHDGKLKKLEDNDKKHDNQLHKL